MQKTGEELAQEGMQQSLLNVDLDWWVTAEQVVRDLAKSHLRFTSDDVLIEVEKRGARSVNNSALGGIIRKAAKDGMIEADGYTKSKRPSRHSAPVRIWRSNIYERSAF